MCVKVHDDWDAFLGYWRDDLGAPGRLVAFSKFGARPHAEAGGRFSDDETPRATSSHPFFIKQPRGRTAVELNYG